MNTTTTTNSCTSSNVVNSSVTIASFQTAFEKTADARTGLAANELLPINLEIPSAISTVLAALPRARTLHSQIVPLFTAAEVAEIDAIETYADALSFAHTAYLAASQPVPPLHDLFERATELRDMLMSDATALANRGIIDGKVLADLKGGTGYLAVAYDLGAIVRLMRERWSDIASRTAVQPSELAEAEQIHEEVIRAFAARERQSDAASAASNERARAFTLFMHAYDQLRRAATFVRWVEGDADKFVPSLYAGRGGRGSAKTTPVPVPAPAPTAPVPAPTVASTEPGMPGGSPFTA